MLFLSRLSIAKYTISSTTFILIQIILKLNLTLQSLDLGLHCPLIGFEHALLIFFFIYLRFVHWVASHIFAWCLVSNNLLIIDKCSQTAYILVLYLLWIYDQCMLTFWHALYTMTCDIIWSIFSFVLFIFIFLQWTSKALHEHLMTGRWLK